MFGNSFGNFSGVIYFKFWYLGGFFGVILCCYVYFLGCFFFDVGFGVLFFILLLCMCFWVLFCFVVLFFGFGNLVEFFIYLLILFYQVFCFYDFFLFVVWLFVLVIRVFCLILGFQCVYDMNEFSFLDMFDFFVICGCLYKDNVIL